MPPTARAAALVITVPAFAASGASEHARTWAHADLEHGFGTQWGVGDARVLDHRAFDVEKPVEYPVHQALFGCFLLSAVSCALWGVEGACRIIVCDQAGRCDREALCPIPRWVAGACCLRHRWSCLRRCRGSGRRARAWRPRARSISGPGGFPGLVRSRCWRFPARRCVPRPLPVPCAVGGRARTGRRRAGSPICRSGVPGGRDGLPSQGALHALRRERPSGRGPAGLRADAHGRRPGHRIVPPGRQGDRPGAAGVPAHAAHARRRAGALPARRTLASARGGRVQAARRAPVRDRGPRPGERARALAGARQTALGARGVLRPGRRRMDGRGRGRGLRREQRLRAGLPGALPPRRGRVRPLPPGQEPQRERDRRGTQGPPARTGGSRRPGGRQTAQAHEIPAHGLAPHTRTMGVPGDRTTRPLRETGLALLRRGRTPMAGRPGIRRPPPRARRLERAPVRRGPRQGHPLPGLREPRPPTDARTDRTRGRHLPWNRRQALRLVRPPARIPHGRHLRARPPSRHQRQGRGSQQHDQDPQTQTLRTTRRRIPLPQDHGRQQEKTTMAAPSTPLNAQKSAKNLNSSAVPLPRRRSRFRAYATGRSHARCAARAPACAAPESRPHRSG